MDDLDTILNAISVDERIEDGIPNFENPAHVDVLRELMVKNGFHQSMAIELCNRLVEAKGKHPERQAFNKNGILVTFPTPDHKAKAISAGTHFDNDPTKAPPNVTFNQPDTAQQPDTSSQAQPIQPVAPGSSTAPQPDQSVPIAPISQQTKDVPKTPEEKEAEKLVIKQIVRSNDSILDEITEWLVYNGPDHIRKILLK